MHPPKIFISATSGDLGTIRQIVKEALLTINCHPVEQTNFEPDARTVENMLRGKIGDCQALIHICGIRYGAEPDVATLPPGTPRRSYTQMEYQIARQLQEQRGDDHFRVYTFICPEDFPYDQEPDTERHEKRDLQIAHRSRLFDDPHLREKPRDGADLKLRVLALQEQVFVLKQEQAEIKTEVLKNRYLGLKTFAVLLLLLSGIYGGMHFLQRGQQDLKQNVETLPTRVEESIRKGYTVDATRIRIQLEAASQKKRDADIVEANDIAKHPKWDNRQKLREEAESAHQQRLSRVTEYARDFAELASAQDASPVLIEMGRIIETEGVDAALAYFETQRGNVFKRAKSRLTTAHDAVRRELQPSLKAAGLLATKGDSNAARASFQEILDLEPDWPEAIDAFAVFLSDASIQSKEHGSHLAALTDAEAMYILATRLQKLASKDFAALSLLSSASKLKADVLLLRRQPGDAEKAHEHYQASLEYAQKLRTANPDSSLALRYVTQSLNALADFLARRSQPGDAEKAFDHYQRSLEASEELLKSASNSSELVNDVVSSLDRLGLFLAKRRLPGDEEEAIAYFQRSLDLTEKLLSSEKASTDIQHNTSVSLVRLGSFLVRRGRPGDAEKALTHFQRSLDIAENLLINNPKSAQAARDVTGCLDELGLFFTNRGKQCDAKQSIIYFERSLEIRERLLITNPESAETLRDVSVSLNNLGDILVKRGQPGDAESAISYYRRALEQSERILLANADSAEAARDVSLCFGKLGGLLISRGQPGDAEKALAYFQSSLETDEKLLTANPESAQAARDFSVSLERLGGFFASRGQPGDAGKALIYYERSHAFAERIFKSNPNSAGAASDFSISLDQIGSVLASRGLTGDAERALTFFNRSLRIKEELLNANLDSAEAARGLALSHYNIAFLKADLGDATGKTKHLRACYDVLAPRIARGMTFDQQALDVFKQLTQKFGNK